MLDTKRVKINDSETTTKASTGRRTFFARFAFAGEAYVGGIEFLSVAVCADSSAVIAQCRQT